VLVPAPEPLLPDVFPLEPPHPAATAATSASSTASAAIEYKRRACAVFIPSDTRVGEERIPKSAAAVPPYHST
jgi:hypothetical protein